MRARSSVRSLFECVDFSMAQQSRLTNPRFEHKASHAPLEGSAITFKRVSSSPPPRWRGEGGGEGAVPQAQTRVEVPSPAPTLGGKGGGDLSPQAGRGEARHVKCHSPAVPGEV